MTVEQQKPKQNVVEMAKKKRHIYLLEKMQKGKALSPSELQELAKYENGDDVSPSIVETQKDVARAFAVSARTVRYWIEDGMPVEEDGRFDLVRIQSWKFFKKEKKGNKDNGSGEKTNWEAKEIEFKAKLKEIAYKEKMGQLIDRSIAEEALSEIIITAKRQFLSLPKQIAPQLVGLDAQKIDEILDERLKEIIGGFAEGRFI